MRIDFDAAERGALLKAARSSVVAAVWKQPGDAGLGAGLAQEEVFGVFTTLRRGGRLRGCIGHWPTGGELDRLGRMLHESAGHAATRDTRFPAVHPSELDFLEVELSILFPPQLLSGDPEERLSGVTPGKHGVFLHYRGRRGLLLPQVAEERGWDAPTFLDQLCVKTGVPVGAWRDPKAELEVFEGLHFGHAPPRVEITLKQIASGIAGRLAASLRCPNAPDLAALQEQPFEFWTGILAETRDGPQVWLRESGTLGLLLEDGLARLSGGSAGDSIRRISLLSHAVPLSASDEPQRRGCLGGDAICVRTNDGQLILQMCQERSADPVPAALHRAGLNRSQWLSGQAEVMAFLVSLA